MIYSDYDPVTVEYAREILKGVPNTYAFAANAAHPEELLESPEVKEILKGRRDVAFVAWGLTSFLPDEALKHFTSCLYEWSGPKSCFAFHAQGAGVDTTDPATIQVMKIYEQMGTPLTFRSLERFKQLVSPWCPDGKGFVSLLSWHGLESTMMTETDVKNFGPGGIGYAAYLVK